MNKVDRIAQFWQSFLDSLPAVKRISYKKYSVWHFCNNEKDANELVDLVLQRKKTATCGLLWSYEMEGEILPKTGEISIITTWVGEPMCIIETSDVKITPFEDVKEEHALKEGEGDLSLAYWRRVHWEVFSRECAKIGKEACEDMPLVCEQFELIYLKKRRNFRLESLDNSF